MSIDRKNQRLRDSFQSYPVPSIRPPIYVLEDENGDLFLSTKATCGDSTSRVVLDDHRLWDAYFEACIAMNKARQKVQDALRVPQKSDP